MSQKTKIYRVLIIPDIHIPYVDTEAMSVVEKFMADYTWDEYVNLGDLMDFDIISSFNADNLRELETRRLVSDFEAANTLLDRHQRIIRERNKNAKFTLIEGNHEERVGRLLNKNPHLEGLLEVEKNLRLAERKMKWVKNWSNGELYNIGKLYFAHGLTTTKYHASKMVDVYGVNMAYGHTHDVQSYAKVILGKDKIIKATSFGHLSDENKLTWMKKRPNNWCHAIGVAEIRPDGDFTMYALEIINHSFSFNGKIYQ